MPSCANQNDTENAGTIALHLIICQIDLWKLREGESIDFAAQYKEDRALALLFVFMLISWDVYSRAPRGRVDWNSACLSITSVAVMSRPTRARGLKHLSSTFSASVISSRPFRFPGSKDHQVAGILFRRKRLKSIHCRFLREDAE